MLSVLLKVEQNGTEVEVEEAVLGAAFVPKFLYLTAEGREFKQPTVLPEQTTDVGACRRNISVKRVISPVWSSQRVYLILESFWRRMESFSRDGRSK